MTIAAILLSFFPGAFFGIAVGMYVNWYASNGEVWTFTIVGSLIGVVLTWSTVGLIYYSKRHPEKHWFRGSGR